MRNPHEFSSWASRHDAIMQTLLRAMLGEATPAVKAFLQPKEIGGELTFHLTEALFVAKRK